MRLSIIFELLLIFLLIAFAAYGRVIDSKVAGKKLSKSHSSAAISLKQATENVNKYCVCNENICNCCRDFHIPVVKLSGPGCASLQYLQDNKLAMQLSIGDNILSSNIINGKDPKPVCVTLPGGFSKFCGKIYSIKKEADNHFKACLGLELRSVSELEASLRVSCFRFGPDGLKLRPAEPLPTTFTTSSTTDDDYDDIFGLDDDDEDDDDSDDDDEDTENEDFEKISVQSSSISTANNQQDQEQGQQEEDDDDDILGLSALLDIFTNDDDPAINKKRKPALSIPLPTSFTIPIISYMSTPNPASESHLSKFPILSGSLTLNNVHTTPVSNIYPYSTKISVSNENDHKIDTTVENTLDTTTINYDTPIMETLYKDDIQTTEAGTIENINMHFEAEKILSNLNKKESNINSTETQQLNKKQINASTTKIHNGSKITKIGNKEQIISANIDVDNSSDSIYDEENDEDDQINQETIKNIKKIESTNESDKTANSENMETLDENYDQSYEESDEDEKEDLEVMSTLLDDDSTKEESNHKHKLKISKVTSIDNVEPTSIDYNYELTEILGRKYSNHSNTKSVKRKIENMRK